MRPLTQVDIESAFPAKSLKKVSLPNLNGINWDALDYFGWNHTSGHRGYVVFHDGTSLRGIILDKTKQVSSRKMTMCSWCLTVHRGGDVNLFMTTLVNYKNRQLGEYICSNLHCSLYIRGILRTEACQMRESIDLEGKIARLKNNIGAFFDKAYQ